MFGMFEEQQEERCVGWSRLKEREEQEGPDCIGPCGLL